MELIEGTVQLRHFRLEDKERLIELLKQQDETIEPQAHAYLVAVGEHSAESAAKLAYDLRAQIPELRLITNLNGGSFKAQFKRADRSGAELALVLGEEEIKADKLAVKFLRSGDDQLSLARQDASNWIRNHIESK